MAPYSFRADMSGQYFTHLLCWNAVVITHQPPLKPLIQKCAAHLPPLHLLGGHDDDPGVLLKHHPPEVADGVLQTALSSDVALLPLGAVALHVQLRLHARTQTRFPTESTDWERRRHGNSTNWRCVLMTRWLICVCVCEDEARCYFTMMMLALM